MPQSVLVLHVDDDPSFTELVATFLERKSDRLDVISETSADAGLDRLAEEDIDCVVSDYQMPGTDGIEFLEAVREGSPDLPFILFTGKGSEEVAADALEAGATNYLQKKSGSEQYDLLANRILNAVEKYRAEQRATDLERVRKIVRDVNGALVRATTREGIETRVCERLSEAAPYRFAWIGSPDPETDRIEPRASAGAGDGYLDTVTITTDDSPAGQGPAGKAFRERELIVAQNVGEDPDLTRWREEAIEHDFHSIAAIPLEYDGSLYGLLMVYSDRTHVFDETERELLSDLGDNVAYAIDAVETREALREERDRRAALFEDERAPIVELGFEADAGAAAIRDVNASFEAVFGMDAEAVIGTTVEETLVPGTDADLPADAVRRAQEGERLEIEVRRDTSDDVRDFLLRLIPFDAGEHTWGAYAIYVDVTERTDRTRRIEALHESTRRLMTAEDAESVATITADAAESTLDYPINAVRLYVEDEDALYPAAVSDGARAELGERPVYPVGDSLVGEAFATGERVVYDDVADVDDGYERGDARSAMYVPIGEHGLLSVVETTPGAFDDADVQLASILAANAQAALSRIDAERELREQSHLLDQIFTHVPAALYVKDSEGRHVRMSEYDIDPEEVIGKTDLEIYPEELAEETYADDMYVIETGEPIINKEEYNPVDDEWVLTSKVPWYDEDGEINGLIGVSRFITEKKEYERQLVEQERLERFVSIVSHDLRNPLHIARNRLELARQSGDAVDEYLDSVDDALERMAGIIDETLSLARHGQAVEEPESVDIHRLADECWQRVGTTDVTVDIEAETTIEADRERLERVFENLFTNALEHGETITAVRVGATDDRGFYVEDDGRGIPEDEREEVFEPGYSTMQDGTGFGLALVEEIAEAHDWDVTVTDGQDGGARFEFTGVTVRE